MERSAIIEEIKSLVKDERDLYVIVRRPIGRQSGCFALDPVIIPADRTQTAVYLRYWVARLFKLDFSVGTFMPEDGVVVDQNPGEFCANISQQVYGDCSYLRCQRL